MREEIKVGRDWRVIEADDNGVIEYIDGTPVCDIDEHDIATCSDALRKHRENEVYTNSQDLSMISEREAYKIEQGLDERRGK